MSSLLKDRIEEKNITLHDFYRYADNLCLLAKSCLENGTKAAGSFTAEHLRLEDDGHFVLESTEVEDEGTPCESDYIYALGLVFAEILSVTSFAPMQKEASLKRVSSKKASSKKKRSVFNWQNKLSTYPFEQKRIKLLAIVERAISKENPYLSIDELRMALTKSNRFSGLKQILLGLLLLLLGIVIYSLVLRRAAHPSVLSDLGRSFMNDSLFLPL